MDGEAGWWTTSGNIGLPPLARVMGVGRQQQSARCFVQIKTLCVYGFMYFLAALMWLTLGRHPVEKTLLQYSLSTPLERECYEVEAQPYRKTDYKPTIYIYIYIILICLCVFDVMVMSSM